MRPSRLVPLPPQAHPRHVQTALSLPPTGGNGPLLPNGGPVQHHPQVFVLFWGPEWAGGSLNGTIIADVQAFFQHTAGSAWNDVLFQYYDTADQIHNDTPLAGSWQTDDVPPADMSDVDIGNEIDHAIAVRGWWTGPDTQFVVMPQQGSTYDWAELNLSRSGTCAWHGLNATQTNGYVNVDGLPYVGDSASGCANATGGNVAGAVTFEASHEYAESATDPVPNSGWHSETGTAEIADLCQYAGTGPNGETATYLYSNADGQCVISFSPVYSYQYVGSGSSSLAPAMAPSHAYAQWLQIRNTGNVPWPVGPSGIVRLGTNDPHDRCSMFADASWMSCSRVALSRNATLQSTTPVRPGDVGQFSWSWTAPGGAAAGSYTEYFDPVAEGITWFPYAGSGLFWALPVGSYQAAYATQTDMPDGVALPGMTYTVSVTFTNTGTCPWFPREAVDLITSHPYWRSSAFQDASWPYPWEPTTLNTASQVDPGQTATFSFQLSVPPTILPGTYDEYFDFIANGSWYSNSGYHVHMVVA